SFRSIECLLDDPLDISKAVDANKRVSYLFGSMKMPQVPSHMFAHLDIMFFPLEPGMHMSMFESHQQALFPARHNVRQVVEGWIDARVEQLSQRVTLAEYPRIAKTGAANQDAVNACSPNALCSLVQAMYIAVAKNQR